MENTQNQAWANDKSRFGFKMMEKMGWSEGKGIGKHSDGETAHVKIALKQNASGIGATAGMHDGWFGVAGDYSDLLARLNQDGEEGGGADEGGGAAAKKAKKAKKSKRRSGDDDDDDVDAERKPSKKAKGAKEGKKKKKKKKHKKDKGEKAENAQGVSARRANRRLTAAKSASGYSKEAMDEILGRPKAS